MSEQTPIPFTQYLLPLGRKRDVSISRPHEISEQAQRLIEVGCRFEIEILMTGQVSMTCERDDEEGEVEVLAMKICANGPGIGTAVDELVTAATREAAAKAEHQS